MSTTGPTCSRASPPIGVAHRAGAVGVEEQLQAVAPHVGTVVDDRLPDGTGLVFVPKMLSPNFWLLDFASNQHRQLTRLDDRGRVNMFDIAPDGKVIVFEQVRENSDIVLIDLPR